MWKVGNRGIYKNMANGEYIPVGAKPDRSSRVARAVDHLKHLAKLRAEKDMAGRELLDRIRNLGNIGIQPVQFEIVKPLDGPAILSRHFRRSTIRADTIRLVEGAHESAQRYARLKPALGYPLPATEESNAQRLRTAILLDGATGTVMELRSVGGDPVAYPHVRLPEMAYVCSDYTDIMFNPRDPRDRFGPRNCVPVWGESLEPLSRHDNPERLTRQVDELIP